MSAPGLDAYTAPNTGLIPQLPSDPSFVPNVTSATPVPTAAPEPPLNTNGQVNGSSTSSGPSAADQAKIDAFNAQNQGVLDSAGTAVGSSATSYHQGIVDYLHSLATGQQAIDNRGIQSELAKKQGMNGVMSMVGDGVRSGGVMLGNKNAGDSSAVEALARAYSTLGQRQAAGVGNQYANDQNGIKQAQTEQDWQQNDGMVKLQNGKTDTINSIVNDAQQKIGALKTSMAYASLPDSINLQQEIESIRSNALAQLGQYDPQLTNGVASQHPMDQATRQGNAATLANAGTAAATPYNYTSDVPAQFQGTGPFASDLPLFTLPKSKQTA